MQCHPPACIERALQVLLPVFSAVFSLVLRGCGHLVAAVVLDLRGVEGDDGGVPAEQSARPVG